jgi:hypothetical protein
MLKVKTLHYKKIKADTVNSCFLLLRRTFAAHLAKSITQYKKGEYSQKELMDG